MDFSSWIKKHNLNFGIVTQLKEEEMDDIYTLQKFPLDQICTLHLTPEDEDLLRKALQCLHNEDDMAGRTSPQYGTNRHQNSNSQPGRDRANSSRDDPNRGRTSPPYTSNTHQNQDNQSDIDRVTRSRDDPNRGISLKDNDVPLFTKNGDFKDWAQRHKLDEQIVRRLEEEDLDDLKNLKEFPLDQIQTLRFGREQQVAFIKAFHSLQNVRASPPHGTNTNQYHDRETKQADRDRGTRSRDDPNRGRTSSPYGTRTHQNRDNKADRNRGTRSRDDPNRERVNPPYVTNTNQNDDRQADRDRGTRSRDDPNRGKSSNVVRSSGVIKTVKIQRIQEEAKSSPQKHLSASCSIYARNYPFGRDVNVEKNGGLDPQHQTEPDKEYKSHNPKMYTTPIQLEPPEDFTPLPVQSQAAPKPAPPKVPQKPFRDAGVFKNVDTHAIEVSKLEHRSFRDLMWHLIYARNITNELEKARAIFMWLCTKNLADLNFGQVDKGSPEEILLHLKTANNTYSTVYETLCSYAGLHCKTINGYAKGSSYKPGMKFKDNQGCHVFNAVLVNGDWRLVDCHWAAIRLLGKKVTTENVQYELDDYYFMPDPHQLIFTHFPEDENWQLMERPISMEDFENLVPVKSAFFKCGLQILSHKEAVISTTREITIRLGYPPTKTQGLTFTFTLIYENGRNKFKGTKLNRFGMHEMVDNIAFFTIRPPENEAYRLIIYANDTSRQNTAGIYGGVCEYKLLCANSTSLPQPFPPCEQTCWGLGDSAYKYDIEPLQKGAIINTKDGHAEVKFRLPKALRFTGKLKSNTQDENALQCYIMHRVVDKVAFFTVSAPSKGEFGLEIYANDPKMDGTTLYHAFQYLILCTEDIGPVEPLPLLQPGYLGPQPSYEKLFLQTVTNNDPYIQTETGELEIAFTMKEPLTLSSELIFVSGGENKNCSDHVLQQGKDRKVYFNLRLSNIGKLQIYGLPYSDTSRSLPGVFNYLIDCRATKSPPTGFPKQYCEWREGCYLYEPKDGKQTPDLPNKSIANKTQNIYFKMSVPKANSVAVFIGDDFNPLEKKDGENWEGEVVIDDQLGQETKASVCASLGTATTSYNKLLEYSL